MPNNIEFEKSRQFHRNSLQRVSNIDQDQQPAPWVIIEKKAKTQGKNGNSEYSGTYTVALPNNEQRVYFVKRDSDVDVAIEYLSGQINSFIAKQLSHLVPGASVAPNILVRVSKDGRESEVHLASLKHQDTLVNRPSHEMVGKEEKSFSAGFWNVDVTKDIVKIIQDAGLYQAHILLHLARSFTGDTDEHSGNIHIILTLPKSSDENIAQRIYLATLANKIGRLADKLGNTSWFQRSKDDIISLATLLNDYHHGGGIIDFQQDEKASAASFTILESLDFGHGLRNYHRKKADDFDGNHALSNAAKIAQRKPTMHAAEYSSAQPDYFKTPEAILVTQQFLELFDSNTKKAFNQMLDASLLDLKQAFGVDVFNKLLASIMKELGINEKVISELIAQIKEEFARNQEELKLDDSEAGFACQWQEELNEFMAGKLILTIKTILGDCYHKKLTEIQLQHINAVHHVIKTRRAKPLPTDSKEYFDACKTELDADERSYRDRHKQQQRQIRAHYKDVVKCDGYAHMEQAEDAENNISNIALELVYQSLHCDQEILSWFPPSIANQLVRSGEKFANSYQLRHHHDRLEQLYIHICQDDNSEYEQFIEDYDDNIYASMFIIQQKHWDIVHNLRKNQLNNDVPKNAEDFIRRQQIFNTQYSQWKQHIQRIDNAPVEMDKIAAYKATLRQYVYLKTLKDAPVGSEAHTIYKHIIELSTLKLRTNNSRAASDYLQRALIEVYGKYYFHLKTQQFASFYERKRQNILKDMDACAFMLLAFREFNAHKDNNTYRMLRKTAGTITSTALTLSLSIILFVVLQLSLAGIVVTVALPTTLYLAKIAYNKHRYGVLSPNPYSNKTATSALLIPAMQNQVKNIDKLQRECIQERNNEHSPLTMAKHALQKKL